MNKNTDENNKFPGFVPEIDDGFFMYPIMLDEYWHILTGSELKVLTFIMRQTIGWNKTFDCISWKQFSKGIGGRSSNMGTGLSVAQIRTAAKRLEEKGFIWIVRRRVAPCIFRLRLAGEKENPFTEKIEGDDRTAKEIADDMATDYEEFLEENENKRIKYTNRLDSYCGNKPPPDPKPQKNWILTIPKN